MSYKLQVSSGKIDESLQEVAKEQIKKALDEIQSSELSDDKKVHQLRKRFKKIRALLRVFRGSFPDYKKENKYFRDLGRKLSELRDAETRIQTLESLQNDYEKEIKLRVFRKAEDELLDGKLNHILAFSRKEGDFETIEDSLNSSLDRIKGWKLEKSGFDSIEEGLMKTYSRARKNHKKLDADSKPEDFHQWRKRAKYFRYQLKLLRNLWPEAMNFERKAWHQLTDDLGDDHDLHVLAGNIQKMKGLKKKEKQLLMSLIELKHREFRRKSFLLGNYLVSEALELKLKRLKKYWQASLTEEEIEPEVDDSKISPSTPKLLEKQPSYLNH